MKTILYDHHLSLGAKIVPFAGWQMPLQYQGIISEHQTVRNAVGLFDVSHMGRIHIQGPDAEPFLDYLSTNNIKSASPGSAIYTVWCNEEGGSVDDLIVYKIDTEHFFVIANAGNRTKDFEHLRKEVQKGKWNVKIQSAFSKTGILSLQGPLSEPFLISLLPETASLKPMHFMPLNHDDFYLSRTGYTGAGGYELYGTEDKIIEWWERFLSKGKEYGIQPIGLGARDTLRLEVGFALYGHELSDTISPSESVSSWTIKWDKSRFLGKEALEKRKESLMIRHAYGIRLLEKGIPRQGCPVMREKEKIGEVTSGSFSPLLGQGIALILVKVPLKIGERVALQIRQTLCQAQVVELPFVRKTS